MCYSFYTLTLLLKGKADRERFVLLFAESVRCEALLKIILDLETSQHLTEAALNGRFIDIQLKCKKQTNLRILNVELLVYIHVTAVFSTHVKNRHCTHLITHGRYQHFESF